MPRVQLKLYHYPITATDNNHFMKRVSAIIMFGIRILMRIFVIKKFALDQICCGMVMCGYTGIHISFILAFR